MNFVSFQFLIFGLLSLLLYWSIPDKYRATVLLVASYVFYCFWDWRFTFLLIFLTGSNYLFTQRMDSAVSPKSKKNLLILCLIQNMLFLAIFKYFNFFSEGASRVSRLMGIDLDIPTARILLPLGLSFFIFQTSSYIIDVFRGTIQPSNSIVNFATFVVYFPHMAAGPIMPARILLPQIADKKVKPNFDSIQSAIFLIVVGLFRKIVIADTIAPAVDTILGNRAYFDWKSILVGSIGFGLQIYGDFAGYSSIARGVSRLFGIEMMVNFRQPYLSTSITDFWRRWHISLSSWFRDYLYIPLGGNRGGNGRKYWNLLLVMVIAGLWHGAAFGFILWGFMHGMLLIVNKIFRSRSKYFKNPNGLFLLPSWLLTQICVSFAWVFFRNPHIKDAFSVIGAILKRQVGYFNIPDVLLILAILVLSFALDFAEISLGPKVGKWKPFGKGLVLGSFAVVIFIMKSSSIVPFIYFRF